MSADALSNEMVTFLLRVLENVENAADDAPISTLRKPADVQVEGESNPVSTTADRGANLFAERIATAMSRLRDPASARTIG
jgi:hypothetical protein